jgi:hypothetical protein
MTHCLGMSSFNPPGWGTYLTNTNIPDTAEGGGVGTFYVFNGPSIKHLLTSNNGGPGGSARPTAVHAAGPNGGGAGVNFGGETYVGAQDHGNAVYEFSRRYTVNKVFSLMYRDAFGYGTENPAKWGTFYSVLNETSKVVTVRGGTGTNNDTISITRTGNTVFVSVDPTVDVPGTGELAGAGNLPAWITEYDISQISSITIDAGAGNDTITIGSDIGVPITINANAGTDTITVNETAPATPVTIVNSTGDDTVNVNIDNAGFAEVRFNSTMTLGALNVGNGGRANMIANGTRALVSRAVSVVGSGQIDLHDNDMIVEYTGATMLPLVQQLIQVARTGGSWDGGGIMSSSA